VFGLEKVDQKHYNTSIKLMETMQCDELRFSSGELRDKKFRSDQEVKTVCSTLLLKFTAYGLLNVSDKWVKRCKKCIACRGKYFEKETYTSPPQGSDPE
jgi:hypothetical protein